MDALKEVMDNMEVVDDAETDDSKHCDNCISGWVHYEEKQKYCDCEKGKNKRKQDIEKNITQAEIPKRYQKACLSDFSEDKKYIKVVNAFVDRADNILNNTEGKKGIFFTGPPGTGKTHLSVAILKAIIEEHLYNHRVVSGMFASVPRMLSRLRPGGDEGYLNRIIEAEFLILDDLGREKSSEWVEEQLYLALNERYNELRPTIITANYGLEELGGGTWGALADRLAEFLHVMEIDGKNYRKEGI